jgi:hypothetical protein
MENKLTFGLFGCLCKRYLKRVNADTVIDFEPHGLKTSLLTWLSGQTLWRNYFGYCPVSRPLYFSTKCASPSVAKFCKIPRLKLAYGLHHCVILSCFSALGLERGNTPIEMQVTKEGRDWQAIHRTCFQNGLPLIGLNIGCGTPDAMVKRPDLTHLAQCFHQLLEEQPANIVVSGAPFEKDVNQTFMGLLHQLRPDALIVDAAGQTTLSSSSGLIDACDIFISTDSGPYHMAVALRKPTLVWFTYAEVTSYHNHPWCRRLIQPSVENFV